MPKPAFQPTPSAISTTPSPPRPVCAMLSSLAPFHTLSAYARMSMVTLLPSVR
ncbi:hypothetical protein ACFQHO_04365 [Actinomadura yumaensis]|uniref:hypothetical protein n=1 Tax=Actinomadura yumaensis TaxID=111807 RepID=UPI003623DFC9